MSSSRKFILFDETEKFYQIIHDYITFLCILDDHKFRVLFCYLIFDIRRIVERYNNIKQCNWK